MGRLCNGSGVLPHLNKLWIFGNKYTQLGECMTMVVIIIVMGVRASDATARAKGHTKGSPGGGRYTKMDGIDTCILNMIILFRSNELLCKLGLSLYYELII